MTKAVELLEGVRDERHIPAGGVPAELPEPADDLDIRRAVLDGKRIDEGLASAITDGTLERGMEGASTLTLEVNDPERELIHSGIFGKKVKAADREVADEDIFLTLDGRDFALLNINKNDDIFELVFENRAIHELRKHDKPKKAYRDKVTRAEFVLALVREVKGYHINFHSPELHKEQPIASKSQRKRRSTRDKLRHRGIGHGAGITVKHVAASGVQISYINRVLDVGSSLNAPYPVMVAAIETITQESDVENSLGHGGVDVGLFDQNVHMGWPASRDVERDAHAFFSRAIAVYRSNPQLSASGIAQAVQRSGAGQSYYEQWKSEAIATVRAYGAHGGGGSITLDRLKRFAFQRGQSGKREDSWTTIKRLADDVRWRAFMVDDVLYFLDDDELIHSAPRMHIDERSKGVNYINYNLTTGKKVNEVTVSCRADRWAAPPGTVVVLKDSMGPAKGRWLVWNISRPIYSKDTTVTLRLPQHPKPEPAPESETVTLHGAAAAAGGGSGVAAVDKAYAAAKAISKRRYGYVWGGGHNSSFSGPYDCSGYMSAIAHAAGWMDSPEVSGWFASSFGHRGEGRYLTFWANSGHVFCEFHLPGKGVEHFGTGRWGTSNGGAGFKPNLHPHAGFTPRHWPGT